MDKAIQLEGDEVPAVEAMLQFMYTYDYTAVTEASSSPMLFHVSMYSIADKYDVPELRLRAEKKFKNTVETCWSMDDFPFAISRVYHSTPSTVRGLRDIVVDAAHEHIESLLCKQDFRDVLEGTTGFASDLVHLLAKH